MKPLLSGFSSPPQSTSMVAAKDRKKNETNDSKNKLSIRF